MLKHSSNIKYRIIMDKLLENYKKLTAHGINEAYSLPFEVYTKPEIYELERQHIFHNEWVFICCEKEVANVGDYYAFDLAGEAIALVRGKDGELRALSNICRHRGTPLLDEGLGNFERMIVCPYHAWAYDDQGSIKAIPLKEEMPIERNQHCLPNFKVAIWNSLVFVNLNNNAAPFEERVAGLNPYLELFEIERFKEHNPNNPNNAIEYWDANWKLAMENAMESYHLFKVHENTLEKTTPTRQAFYIAGSSEATLTGGRMAMDQSLLTKIFQSTYSDVYNHYILVSLPPSFVGILTYESFDWLQVMPLSESRCQIRSGGITTKAKYYNDKATQEFTKAFYDEDKWICERVQKGMYSQYSEGGKLVDMERVVVDFHQFLGTRLFNHEKQELYIQADTVFTQS